jgi:protein SCO1
MDSGIRNTVLACVVAVLVVLGLTVYLTVRETTLSAQQLRELGVYELPAPRELAPFELTDQHGQPFTKADLDGRWSFVFFGFTHCPDICPVTMSALSRVEQQLQRAGLDALHDAFNGVMVTVDPERDDAETLGRYVGAFSSRFTGVVGTRAELAAFARQLNAAFAKVPGPDPSEAGTYTVDHTTNVVIINPRGDYHGFISPPHDSEAIERAYLSLARRF